MINFEFIGTVDGSTEAEIIKKDNRYYCLDGWNGECYYDCCEIEKPFYTGYGHNIVPVNAETLTFTPIHRYQAEDIDLDMINESSDDWDNAVEVVDYDIRES